MNKRQVILVGALTIIAFIVGLILFHHNVLGVTKLDILAEKPESEPIIRVMMKIPVKYTCDGEDISPPILWDVETLPDETKSLALVMFDPDAPHGTFIHWIMYNINPEVGGLPEDIPKQPIVEGLGLQGVNDFGMMGYGGPCPPPGPPHRYFIRILALNQELDVRPGLNIEEFKKAIENRVVGYGDIIGVYTRE